MRKTTRTFLLSKDKSLVGVEVKTEDDKFIIPVVNVTKSDSRRKFGEKIIKSSNATKGSKYLKPSFSEWGKSYQISHKK